MEKDASSEEKLLKLIRKKGPGRQPEPKGVRPSSGKKDFDAGKFINTILFLVVVVSLASVGWFFAQSQLTGSNDAMLNESTVSIEPEPLEAVSVKPVSHYEKIIAQRDIFNTSFQKTPQAVPAPGPTPAVQQPANPFSHLSLVGVVMDNDPQAIIFNRNTQETMFLKQGESIDGVVVEEVSEGRVILYTQEQTIELSL